MSLKDKIFAVDDIKKEVVQVPTWDNISIEVRSMSGLQRANLLNSAMDSDGNTNLEKLHSGTIIVCCYDPETGEHVFDESDAERLMEKGSAAIEKLASKAMSLSGLTPEAVEESEKNL